MNLKKIIFVIVGVFFVVLPILHAQPVRDKILSNLELSEEGECVVIHISFHYPVRYIKHFPYESGEEVRTQVLPILISPVDKEAFFSRESIRPPKDNPAGLAEVMYEGDMEGGPFLTLLFNQHMAFKVRQGEDYRSLDITVSKPEADASCVKNP
jgi:hypothetical protein